MALNLLNSFGAKGVNYGITSAQADVIDTEYLSKYFVISEFNPTFTAGRNSLSMNGSSFLVSGGKIIIECLDSTGNCLFVEVAKYSNNSNSLPYNDASGYVYSIHVYDDTSDGVGRITLYGTLIDGRTVKWSQNITIDKSLKNQSRVRFYQAPTLEIDSAEVPVLNSTVSSGLMSNLTLTGIVQGFAITPKKDTNLSDVNKQSTDVDYRLTLISPIVNNGSAAQDGFNSQMIGAKINLTVNKIQQPLSQTEISVSQKLSFVISNVISNDTLQISYPYSYTDASGNNSVTNITNANFSIEYPFVNYNTATSSYQTTTIGATTYVIKQSYADILYRNLRTFSGYVARHKIYRKSLLSNADFSIIADEPIIPNQILMDDLTQNKYYDLLGKFSNSQHISRYWFTSSNNLSMSSTPHYAIDSMYVSSPNPSNLIGNDYLLVKNDSVNTNRNAIYIPHDDTQFLANSGSAYDSNFMALKSNVQYSINISATVIKDAADTTAGLSFYFTSSVSDASKESNYTNRHGIKVAELLANQSSSIVDFSNAYTFYTPKSNLYGTLVIVPTRCKAYIKNISFKIFGDDGFSPDAYMTRIPWPVSVANETFQIKAELFDANSNLIYSDLSAIKNFDPNGSTLIPYIPGSGGSAQDLTVAGNLTVVQNATIQTGDLYVPNVVARPGQPAISQSRMLSIRADGALVFDPLVDATSDNKYLYLSTGDASNRVLTTITTRKSLSSEYGSLAGRKIYWVGGVKQTESSP